MLSLFLAHIVITTACLWSGQLVYDLFAKSEKQPSLVHKAITGLILLVALSQVVVLFFPVGIYTKFAVAVILLLSAFFKSAALKDLLRNIYAECLSWSGRSLVLFFIIWLIILLINAGPLMMDDTESYHLQSILWIKQYGSVPGLVNLHERFGFNSSWFSAVALFSFSNTSTGGFTILNSVLSMWLCYRSISKFDRFHRENNQPAAFAFLAVLLAAMLVWPLLRGNAATTNYDFVTTCIVLILFVELFFPETLRVSPEWIIWPAFLFTVRIVNFPLLILSITALLVLLKQKQTRTLLLTVTYGLLIIGPFIARNIIIAGYPFYPAIFVDLVNVDWKPDPRITERLLEYIKYYNRVSTTYMDIEQTKALGSNWVPSWFTYLFTYDKVLVVTGVAGLALGFGKRLLQNNRLVLLLRAIAIIWVACWLMISPDPRFVYGILLFGVFLLIYQSGLVIKNNEVIKYGVNFLVLIMITGSAYYFVSKPWKQAEYRNFLVASRMPEPPAKEFVIDGIIFRIPEAINDNWNSRCYGTEIPCLYKIDHRLRLRTKYIRNGFYLEK